MGAGVALVGAAAVLAVGAARPIAEPAALPAAAPNQLVADGVRYAVGLPGDVVVVADWSCTQQATAAVLRPSTGALFVFDAWAVSGAPTTARPVDADPGAVDLSPGASCGRAELVHPDGTRHPVDTAP
ncbi:MAG: hypothetical protein QOF60_58 [Actinomycetota bacterium]|jgi:hypothetical protein|nr:hypothetical protein [Actinomycetota bacterium]